MFLTELQLKNIKLLRNQDFFGIPKEYTKSTYTSRRRYTCKYIQSFARKVQILNNYWAELANLLTVQIAIICFQTQCKTGTNLLLQSLGQTFYSLLLGAE